MMSGNQPVTIAAVGAGHRTRGYCLYALDHPGQMKVVAVADPDPVNRNRLADQHGIPAAMRFDGYEALAQRPRLADAVINGTMDRLHYASAMPLIDKGYHMLLEKPIAPTRQEVCDLVDAARRRNVTVMICHVLRYAPIYRQVKSVLAAGDIGRVVTMRTCEMVSYHHMATSYVRGKWNSSRTSNPILLAKCCHDLDIIAWLMSGQPVARVASFGALTIFRPENAPAGAADRCLDGCQVEQTCPYSVRRLHVDTSFGWGYPFEMLKDPANLTPQQKLDALRGDNPYGRCVWRCDNDVVDHQTVIIQFANGVTATHHLCCATARPTRTIHIVGTGGELEADFETGKITVRHFDPNDATGYRAQTIDTRMTGGGGQGGHGGGDSGLIVDFISTLQGRQPSPGATRVEDSLTSHLIAFAADESMRLGQVVEI